MKTHYFKNISLTFVLCCGYLLLNAQSDNKYLVVFDNISETDIANILLDYNSSQIWKSPYSDVYFCEFNYFPFPDPKTGDPINDINEGTQALDDGEPKVKNIGIDHIVNKTPSGIPNPEEACFNNSLLIGPSETSVVVSILDTGLSVEEDDSDNTYEYGYFTGYDYVDNDEIPEDTQGHGTHIAGIISHVSQHMGGILGTEFNISFDIRKVFDENGESNLSTIIYAFDEAVLAGAKVVNCSFAYYGEASLATSPFQHAIETAQVDEVLVVASASNETQNNDAFTTAFPASFDSDNILAVASHGCDYSISSFSNYGLTTVDIAALGEDMVGPSYLGGITYKSGTSQAAAFASGAAVSLTTYLSAYNYAAVKCAIMEGVDINSLLAPYVLTSGSLNIHGALEELENCGGLLNGNVGSGNSRSVNTKIELSPNPFNEVIYIDMDFEYYDNIEISLFNLFGHSISINKSENKTGYTLGVPYDLASGCYFLHIEYDDKLEIKKLFRE